jgi:predicted TPR repeat methyltransferase
MDQDQEWFFMEHEGQKRKMRLHDYDQLFRFQGLYEKLLVDHLKCDSPKVVCDLLGRELNDWLENQEQVCALDMGAGNGMVGEQLRSCLDCRSLVGVDIFPEAKQAAYRDRPGVYDEYCVTDLTTKEGVREIKSLDQNFNLLLTVAALGYGDIPVTAFVNAFNLLDKGALVAFNIKDRFLSDKDETGFKQAINNICAGSLELLHSQKYRHRYALSGKPLHYVALVGKKLKNADVSACQENYAEI